MLNPTEFTLHWKLFFVFLGIPILFFLLLSVIQRLFRGARGTQVGEKQMSTRTSTSFANGNDNPLRPPMGFGGILDTTFSLYRKHFLLFLGILALYFFGVLVEYTVESFLNPSRFEQLIPRIAAAPFILVSTGGIILATAATYRNRETTSSDALKQTLRRFGPILVCHTLRVLVWGLPFIVLFFLVGQRGPEIGTLLAFLCISMPFSIYFVVRWTFLFEIALLEKPRVRYAFERSSELVEDTWWRVFGIAASIFLLQAAIHYIFQISLGILLSALQFAGDIPFIEIIRWSILDQPSHNSTLLFYAIMTCIDLFLKTFVAPLSIIGITLLYFDLRIRKDAVDIEAQVDDSTAETEHPAANSEA